MPDGSWRREGPAEVLVSEKSAKLWYPQEKQVASNTDHFQIAKLKQNEESIYPAVKSQIRCVLLDLMVVFEEKELLLKEHFYGSSSSSSEENRSPE